MIEMRVILLEVFFSEYDELISFLSFYFVCVAGVCYLRE